MSIKLIIKGGGGGRKKGKLSNDGIIVQVRTQNGKWEKTGNNSNKSKKRGVIQRYIRRKTQRKF